MKNRFSPMMKAAVALLLVFTFVLSPIFPTVAVASDYFEPGKKALEGKYISLMGDSISTYDGWSNTKPIADETVKYRYGEAYYGLPGSGHHNESLLVSDTWWHQAATELGAEMLMVNSGNSTGLLHVNTSAGAEWENYLQGLLAYKSRPYYLGYEGKDPDVIALYIGSNEARMKTTQVNFGSVADVDYHALITENSDGTFTYAEPKTVAESYIILLHKVTETYPKAEVYCFTIVPACGGNIDTVNTRTKTTIITNNIIKDAARYFDVKVVDLFEGFGLDEDGDGKLSQKEYDYLTSCYNGDPHPNAKGFDVITETFVNAVLKDSRYVSVETTAGNDESVTTETMRITDDGVESFERTAENFITENNQKVNFSSVFRNVSLGTVYSERYSSANANKSYKAEGGKETEICYHYPELSIEVPVTATDDPETETDETARVSEGNGESKTRYENDLKSSAKDGVYNYKVITTDGNGKLSVKTNSVTVNKKPLEGQQHDLHFIHNNVVPSESNDLIAKAVDLPSSPEEVREISEGYDFVLYGCNQYSRYWTAYAFRTAEAAKNVRYKQETNEGRTFYFANTINQFASRNLLVDKYYCDGNVYTFAEGVKGPAVFSSIQLYNLSDRNANLVSVYSIDQRVIGDVSGSYKLTNLLDADYYGPEETKKISRISELGYWGEDSAMGNFAAFKQNLANSGKFSQEELDMITEGIAVTATQYAIWACNNFLDGIAYVNVFDGDLNLNPYTGKTVPDENVALIFKIHDYLLADDTSENRPESTIINEENFIDKVNIEVTGKPASDPKNLDGDLSNDVYTADLSFSLKVKPVEKHDDLVMQLFNGDEIIATGRVAGKLGEGEVRLSYDGDKTYTFKGIELEEGSLNLEFVLTGSQYLERGAFLFSSEAGRYASQSMVGIAEGDFAVNVTMNIEFDFAAEDGLATVEHIWRNERNSSGRPIPPKDEEEDEEPEEKNPETGAPVFFG
ncbi:MAG: SGNH/GDSL hydrolase family protein [Oscillospiraceae bacterium]|nr:SGNH/GDSL hydrolase family protein [Oscillospiraceae bacterium]